MITQPASLLCGLAIRLLPGRRQPWGTAMEAELAYIGDDRAALAYAAGCVLAAIRERARDFDTRFAVGLWTIALASAAFALFHLFCAARGVQVLLGRPDGFLDALVRNGQANAALIADYRSARPIVIACLFGLGAAHLAAAYLLVRSRFRGFLFAWCGALVCAAVAVRIQTSLIASSGELPSEFLGLLTQAVALALLLLWSSTRHDQAESEG